MRKISTYLFVALLILTTISSCKKGDSQKLDAHSFDFKAVSSKKIVFWKYDIAGQDKAVNDPINTVNTSGGDTTYTVTGTIKANIGDVVNIYVLGTVYIDGNYLLDTGDKCGCTASFTAN